MIPFYIFYSMFGFQRTGDSIWAMADQLARGFLIGATAGRTTLTGEGLQHADGHSPLLAATNPAVVHYDPAFAYEISHIMQSGLERMYGEGGPNGRARTSSSTSPSTTSRSSSRPSPRTSTPRGSCAGLHQVSDRRGRRSAGAAARLRRRLPVDQGRRPDARRGLGRAAPTPGRSPPGTSWPATPSRPRSGTCSTRARQPRTAYVTGQAGRCSTGPVVAVSDYMRAVPLQIARWVPGDYRVLGADGFGFADTRPGRAPVLPRRRPVGRRPGAAGAGRRRRDRAGEGRRGLRRSTASTTRRPSPTSSRRAATPDAVTFGRRTAPTRHFLRPEVTGRCRFGSRK